MLHKQIRDAREFSYLVRNSPSVSLSLPSLCVSLPLFFVYFFLPVFLSTSLFYPYSLTLSPPTPFFRLFSFQSPSHPLHPSISFSQLPPSLSPSLSLHASSSLSLSFTLSLSFLPSISLPSLLLSASFSSLNILLFWVEFFFCTFLFCKSHRRPALWKTTQKTKYNESNYIPRKKSLNELFHRYKMSYVQPPESLPRSPRLYQNMSFLELLVSKQISKKQFRVFFFQALIASRMYV